VAPLFEFRNYGLPLPYNWTTKNNGAALASTISPSQRWRNPTSSSTPERARPAGVCPWVDSGASARETEFAAGPEVIGGVLLGIVRFALKYPHTFYGWRH